MNLMNEECTKQMLTVIKKAIWNTGNGVADAVIFREMQMHTIAALAAPILSELSLSEDVFQTWEKHCVKTFILNQRCQYAQMSLPLTVPYVILKGTAAAQYYPYPEYRAMGDIDIMTRREDFETACNMLLASGYMEVTDPEDVRHREFKKNDVLIEVHRYFAVLNDKRQAEYLDNLIIDHINPSHVLPDLVNGVVLLEHIGHHLENGLGLRQIIDWMMFVNKCLPDKKWLEFQTLLKPLDLEVLAIATTRMCEMYLGLPERNWCANADETLCQRLMEYVLSSGNFGNKRNRDETEYNIDTFVRARTPKAAVSLFQKRGLENWKAAHNHAVLRPFAWIYQAGRYLIKGLTRRNASAALKAEWDEAQHRNALFDDLGVKQTSKGIIEYKEGEYKRTD